MNDAQQAEPPSMPDGVNPCLLSFDVYGTLIDTPPPTRQAFQSILADAAQTNVDPWEFYAFWEQRNIARYEQPYRSYKEICRLSLVDAFRHFKITNGREEAINRYFDCFPSMRLYADVLPTLDVLARRHRLALVSNIDDDLLNATSLGRDFDLVCTAERARGYKPDGQLFRYLIRQSGLSVTEILHSGQSQFTDMVGAKPLGLTVAWINRRSLDLNPGVPRPDFIFSDLKQLPALLGSSGQHDA